MEFAWNTQKNNMSDIKGLENEQERKGKISNEEIDLNKTYLNYDLVQSDLNLYQRVKRRVDEVRPVSRIQKNSVVDFSNIITVPQDQFKEWGIDRSKRYLEEVYNYFCKEIGKENVVSAKVHLDETTPHMHLHFVPVSQDGKLQARVLMTPAKINKIHNDAPEYLREKGFDVVRGVGKTKKSLDIHQYKAEKLKEEIKLLENKLKALEGDLKALDSIESSFTRIDSIKAKKSPIGSKISISEEDYRLLVDLSKKSFMLSSKVDTLQDKITGLEERLHDKQLRVDERLELNNLRSENKDLKQKINKANKIINGLSSDFKEEFLKAKEEFEKPVETREMNYNSLDWER